MAVFTSGTVPSVSSEGVNCEVFKNVPEDLSRNFSFNPSQILTALSR